MTVTDAPTSLRISREDIRGLVSGSLDGEINDPETYSRVENLVTKILLAATLEGLRAGFDVQIGGTLQPRTLQALSKTARKARGELLIRPEYKLLRRVSSGSHGSPATS